MEDCPLVSVCIPTYNRVSLLAKAIKSAQNQSYPNIEIIVSDNCSSDGTADLVGRLAREDHRIRYIHNAENIGPTRNWKVAVEAARGEYCKIVFSDDEIDRDCLSVCVSRFKERPDIAFVITDAVVGRDWCQSRVMHNCPMGEGLRNTKDFIRSALLAKTAVSPCCAVFRTRSVCENIVEHNEYFAFDRYLKNGAGPDLLIFLRTAMESRYFWYVRRPLVLFRESEDSITCAAERDCSKIICLQADYAKARYQFLKDFVPKGNPAWYLIVTYALLGGWRSVKQPLLDRELTLANGENPIPRKSLLQLWLLRVSGRFILHLLLCRWMRRRGVR